MIAEYLFLKVLKIKIIIFLYVQKQNQNGIQGLILASLLFVCLSASFVFLFSSHLEVNASL